jgi:ADP-ribose pyrophosphatase
MARTIVHVGRRIQVAVEEETLPGGAVVRRDLVLHPGAVVILPLLADGSVVLLRNRRPATGETLWEVPAGTLEPGEAPQSAAVRELAEETGYRAGQWRKLHEFYPSPGVLSERMVLFVAQDLTPGPMQLDPGEQIEPYIVPWQQALAWAVDGTIRDGKTLGAILLWHVTGGEPPA